jgi:transposase
MYIDKVPNRNSKPTYLLREVKREGKKIIKNTITNLSDWSLEKIEQLKATLKGEKLVSPQNDFKIFKSRPYGNIAAVLGTIRKIGLENIIASKRTRERDIITALLVERLLHPASKLATSRILKDSALLEDLNLKDVCTKEIYTALDWLYNHQKSIEKKLANKHLTEGGMALYDVSSSYYEGTKCPLAKLGHDRDRKGNHPIIVYGVMTNKEGIPITVSVYPGNTADPKTVPDQAEKLKNQFGLKRIILAGDRGMLTDVQIDHLKTFPGLGWISALRSSAIRKLVDSGSLQPSLFDQQNLAEIISPLFPDERLMACFNPLLSDERTRKREELLKATEKVLKKITDEVKRRKKKLLDKKDIALKAGRNVNKYKMAKHFKLKIEDNHFSFERKAESIEREKMLDGIYIIRTSESKEKLSAEDAVRGYKSLANVERLFRSLKGIDLLVRPIFHRLEKRVRGHIFLCVLAYYVEWHMRKSLAPILYEDEELAQSRVIRNPVAQAVPSTSVKNKKKTHCTTDGLTVHSFDTLMDNLSYLVRNYCTFTIGNKSIVYVKHTEADILQAKAFDLLGITYPAN